MTRESKLAVSHLNVFEGPTSIKDFLNPENNPYLPLVELPYHLNRFRQDGVRIFAKIAYLLPLLNLKSLAALSMLLDAESLGRLQRVNTVVENSSGNMAVSLAVLARLFGVQRLTALVPFDIAPGKLELLRLMGVQTEMRRDAPGELSGIDEARERGSRVGFFNPGQYENEANPAAYEKWLAPQIWEQTRGKITVFAAGLGTTGTLLGSARYFQKCSRKVSIVGVICAPNEAVPGVRSEVKLREIKLDWSKAADSVIEVRTKDSFKRSLELCRSGIMGGPSAGFNLVGLEHFLEARKSQDKFEELRNEEGDILSVFVCGDTPLPYLDKYSTHLEATDF